MRGRVSREAEANGLRSRGGRGRGEAVLDLLDPAAEMTARE